MRVFWVGLCGVLMSCNATAPKITLLPEAQSVKIFRNDDPPIACREIKPVEVAHGDGCGGFGALGNYEGAYSMFKNAVITLGGNAAILQSDVAPGLRGDCFVNAHTLRGVAFYCPQSSLQ